jgi:hypothetical protein
VFPTDGATTKEKQMSLFKALSRRAATAHLRRNNPHLSQESATYLADLFLSVLAVKPDPQEAAATANEIVIARVRAGVKEAVKVLREDLKKHRPVYEKAVGVGKDPVVALMLANPWTEAESRQHVEMFKLIDGTEK